MIDPLAIGIGSRRGCPVDTIVALVEATCAGLDRTGASLCTIDRKRLDADITEAARRLALPLTFFDAARLAAVAAASGSPRVAAAVGTPSVAEAAALAGAGDGARLIVRRRAAGGATCAVARAEPA